MVPLIGIESRNEALVENSRHEGKDELKILVKKHLFKAI